MVHGKTRCAAHAIAAAREGFVHRTAAAQVLPAVRGDGSAPLL